MQNAQSLARGAMILGLSIPERSVVVESSGRFLDRLIGFFLCLGERAVYLRICGDEITVGFGDGERLWWLG